MPIYEYRCNEGHTFDALQGFSDEPLTSCEVCGAPVQRVLHPVAVHFKGSGFYSTDYRGKAKDKAGDGDSSTSSCDGKAEPRKDSNASSGESGSAAKTGSSSD